VTPSEISVQQENQQPAPVKLGPFWLHSPGLWVSQAECQFAVAGLEDQFQLSFNGCNAGNMPEGGREN
jgi:hypothetical protein